MVVVDRGMREWLGDDAGFLNEVRIGKAAEVIVALDLLLLKFPVQLVEPEIRDPSEQRQGQLADQPDLIVGRTQRALIEVKWRDLEFGQHRDSYPYKTAFVGRKERWDKRLALDGPKPVAIVLVSSSYQKLVVSLRTRDEWVIEKRPDRITQREEISYACPREKLASWDNFVKHLRSVTD